ERVGGERLPHLRVAREPLVARRAEVLVARVEVAAVHVAQGAVGGRREAGRGVPGGIRVEALLREERAEAAPAPPARPAGVLPADQLGELLDGGDRRTHPAGAELAELAAILAPLPDARGAVAAVVVRVD